MWRLREELVRLPGIRTEREKGRRCEDPRPDTRHIEIDRETDIRRQARAPSWIIHANEREDFCFSLLAGGLGPSVSLTHNNKERGKRKRRIFFSTISAVLRIHHPGNKERAGPSEKQERVKFSSVCITNGLLVVQLINPNLSGLCVAGRLCL